MEKVHVHPAAHIKPDLYKKIGIILTAPGHIRRAGIKMPPDNSITAGSGVFTTLFPNCLDGAFLFSIDDCPDPEVGGDEVASNASVLDQENSLAL